MDSEIKFFGQPAGMVLADSMSLANFAATLVKITYVEVVDGDEGTMMSVARSIFGQLMGSGLKPVMPTMRDAIDLGATDRFQDAGRQAVASQLGEFN